MAIFGRKTKEPDDDGLKEIGPVKFFIGALLWELVYLWEGRKRRKKHWMAATPPKRPRENR